MHWFVAYIDPGAGSLIVQATIASVVAIPYFFRRQIARVVRLVGRKADESAATTSAADRAS